MFKSFKESSAVCTLANRQLEQAINGKLERGRVAMYSTPSAYGLVFSWKGRNHTVEQDASFDADEVIAKASEWADKLENSGLPKGWSRTP
jgi:hypothetical protein